MQYALIFVLLLSFVFGLGLLARRLVIPFPILFVIGGLLIGFVPIFPTQLRLEPDLVFFLILPPLLYIQAFFTSWRDFKYYLRPILLLAIGLVVITTVVVAFVAHWMIPRLPLSVGFVLGAIISPPDAIAASAIAQRLGLPRRVVTIIEGESLVNDATSLVIFKVALAAVGATVPLFGGAWLPGEFTYVSVGGIAVGLVIGKIAHWIRSRILDAEPQVVLTLSLMIPYVSYLLADQFLHTSGVLAVVATGLYLGYESPEAINSTIRLEAKAVWDMITYLLNGVVFVLIGLQLPGIISTMAEHWWPRPFYQALIISAICVVVRFIWIFPGAYLPYLVFRHVRVSEEMPDWRQVTIVGWCGMRGIVSLAAALTLQGYPNFPRPHLVQFIAFTVIFVSLVFQGLTLPALIRFLGVGDDGIPAREEAEARQLMMAATFEKIHALRQEDKFPTSSLVSVENFFRERALCLAHDRDDDKAHIHSPEHIHFQGVHRLNQMLIATQRRALLGLRRAGKIGDDVVHKIEHELDLEETRLKS